MFAARDVLAVALSATSITLYAFFGFLTWIYFYVEVEAHNHSFLITNSLIFALAVGTTFAWMKGLVEALRKPFWQWDGKLALLSGISCIAIGLAIVFYGLMMFRIYGDTIDHFIFLMGRGFIIIALAQLLVASGSVKGELPPKAYLRLGWAFAAALIVVLLIWFFFEMGTGKEHFVEKFGPARRKSMD